jgi:hypothetical protein
VKSFLWLICRSYGNKWGIILVVTVHTYRLAAAMFRHRYVCTDHAKERSRKLKSDAGNELIHCQPRSTEARIWLSSARWHFPRFSPSGVFARAHLWRSSFQCLSWEGGGENTIFLFFSSFWPENPFSSFVIVFQVIFWLEKKRHHKILRGLMWFRTVRFGTSKSV